MTTRGTPIRWQLFPLFFLVVLAMTGISSLLAVRLLRELYLQHLQDDVAARAQIAAVALSDRDLTRSERLQEVVVAIGNRSGTRVTLIDPSGSALADSDRDPSTAENFAAYPEVATALRGQPDDAIRYSDSRQREMLFYALPISHEGSVVAVVRAAVPMPPAEQIHRPARLLAITAGAIGLLLATLLSILGAQWLARPFEEMRGAIERFGGGDFIHRIGPQSSTEANQIADSLEEMAQKLETRIAELERSNREQETLLAGMVEGVLAVDRAGKVLTLNPAARALFHVPPGLPAPIGRGLEQIIRNPDLLAFVRRALAASEPLQEELVLQETPPRFLRMHGSALRLESGEHLGAIVVFDDVSRDRNMERERRELAASVSHELRTPVTAIHGFLETLRDGAISQPKEAARFVEIALRQSERLQALIEDLVRLARIERENERAEVVRTMQPLRPILASAIEVARTMPGGPEAVFELDCPEDLEAPVDAELLEQAIGNLLSNALRYGAGPIRIRAAASRGHAEVSVHDEGPGIPPEHQERVFERFYVVDKARSRRHGGTGLGLAIVKHTARAHSADVLLESNPDQGTTFTIRLPLAV
jgi:two-component system phosphate regulon sensor histidine kinase PhoR